MQLYGHDKGEKKKTLVEAKEGVNREKKRF